MALIAHYPLNGDTKDYSGYGRVATHSVPVTYSDEGKIGKCRDSGDITLPIGTMNSLEQSITFWLYNKEAISKTATALQFMGGSPRRDYAIFTYPNNDDLHWDSKDPGNATVLGGVLSGVLKNLKWTHVSIIKSPTYFKIYINGILLIYQGYVGSIVETSIKPFPLLHNHPYIRINDIRIYDHALSYKEVKELAKAKVLHYKFDEQDLTTKIVKDSSGFRNDGTVAVATAPSWSEDSPVGRGSMEFSGTKFIDVNHKIPLKDDFTVSFWVKINSTNDTSLGCSRTVLGKGFSIIMLNKAIRWDTGDQQWSTGHVVKLNQWVHYTLVRRGNTKELYENGVLVKSTTYTGSMTNLGNSYSIGMSQISGSGYDNPLNGAVSDYRIYATALTPEDILEIYQTRASTDNLGNLFLQDFDEVSVPAVKSIGSNGVAQFTELNEITSVDKMSFGHDGTLYVNEIKEA